MTNQDLPPCKPDDQWTFSRPLTDAELAHVRSAGLADCIRFGVTQPRFTCSNCTRERTCTLAYDSYNLDGDCLYDK